MKCRCNTRHQLRGHDMNHRRRTRAPATAHRPDTSAPHPAAQVRHAGIRPPTCSPRSASDARSIAPSHTPVPQLPSHTVESPSLSSRGEAGSPAQIRRAAAAGAAPPPEGEHAANGEKTTCESGPQALRRATGLPLSPPDGPAPPQGRTVPQRIHWKQYGISRPTPPRPRTGPSSSPDAFDEHSYSHTPGMAQESVSAQDTEHQTPIESDSLAARDAPHPTHHRPDGHSFITETHRLTAIAPFHTLTP